MILPPCRIEMFGGLRVLLPGCSPKKIPSQKPALLLAYLALYPDRQHLREDLCRWLWPDDSDAGAEDYERRTRQSLRQALTVLRHALTAPDVEVDALLKTTNTHVCLVGAGVATDVAEFQTALKAARGYLLPQKEKVLRQAVSLYRGDLLYGYNDARLNLERYRYRTDYLEAIRQLTELWEQTEVPPDAIDLLSPEEMVDACDEEACLIHMRVYAVCGRIENALAHYAQLERALRAEYQIRPSPEIQELAETLRLRGGSPAKERVIAPLPATPSHACSEVTEANSLGNRRGLALTTTLPSPLSPCFGRERELQQIAYLLTQEGRFSPIPRLVTLTGLGGTGKTRLALEAGNALRTAYDGRVWLINLMELQDVALLPDRILQEMNLSCPATEEATTYLISVLQQCPVLLILDNMEQLLSEDGESPDGASIVSLLLESVSSLSLIVTSRCPLRIDGEHALSIRPLPLPERLETYEELLNSPGIQLFVHRARECRPDFAVSPRNIPDVAALVLHLEGLPLAIVLAAAQIALYTPLEMLTELRRHRFQFLTTRRRGVFPRHRSLHAALDWSASLLSPNVRAIFASLSCFRGDWTRESVEFLWKEVSSADLRQALSQCVEAGLVQTQCAEQVVYDPETDQVKTREQTRFRLLETVREYAQELSAEEPFRRDRDRHAEYYLALAERCAEHFAGPDAALWHDCLSQEYDNIRAGLVWLESVAPAKALRFACHLSTFWYVRGHVAEGRHHFDLLLQHVGNESSLQLAKAYSGAGSLAFAQNDKRSARLLHEKALGVARQNEEHLTIVDALADVGLIDQAEGRETEAQAHFLEAIALLERHPTPAINEVLSRKSYLLNLLGSSAFARKEYDLARAYKEQALEIMRQVGNEQDMAYCLETFGYLEHSLQNWQKAEDLYQASLTIARKLGHRTRIGSALGNLGRLYFDCGRMTEAQYCCEEALGYTRSVGEQYDLACILETLGRVRLFHQDHETARQCLEEAFALWRSMEEASAITECEALLAQCVPSASR